MSIDSEAEGFIRSAFCSIWSLELLLTLRDDPERRWTRSELINGLRASEQVDARSCDELAAAGLIERVGDQIRYAPISAETEQRVAAAAELYAGRPALVRRLIVGAASDPVA